MGRGHALANAAWFPPSAPGRLVRRRQHCHWTPPRDDSGAAHRITCAAHSRGRVRAHTPVAARIAKLRLRRWEG